MTANSNAECAGAAAHLDQFTSDVTRSTEPGLAVCGNEYALVRLAQLLEDRGWLRAASWREVLRYAAEGRAAFIVLRELPDKQLYDTICQRFRRGGMLQIIDPRSLDLISTQFDPAGSPLIVVVEQRALLAIEKRWPLEDKVGLIEFFNVEDV